MKIILISLLFVLSLNAKNYCNTDLVSFSKDKQYKELKSFHRKKSLNLPNTRENKYKKILKLANIIDYERPYDKKVILEFLKESSKLSKKEKDNYRYRELIFRISIFAIDKESKDKLRVIIFRMLKNKGFKTKILKEPNYKYYSVFKNLQILNNKELKEYKSKIKSNKYIEYKILDYIKYGPDKFNNGYIYTEEKEHIQKRKLLREIENTCKLRINIAKKNKNIKIPYYIKMFYMSKLYPEYKRKIIEYYYAISENTEIWNLLEYYYSLKHNNYKIAYLSLKTLFNSLDKPYFLEPDLLEAEKNYAEKSYQTGYKYIAFNESKKILEFLIKRYPNGIDRKLFNISLEAKKILVSSANDILTELINKQNYKEYKIVNDLVNRLSIYIFNLK